MTSHWRTLFEKFKYDLEVYHSSRESFSKTVIYFCKPLKKKTTKCLRKLESKVKAKKRIQEIWVCLFIVSRKCYHARKNLHMSRVIWNLLLQHAIHNFIYNSNVIFLKQKSWFLKDCPRLFHLWSFLDKKLETALQRHYFTRHSCLFNYFLSLAHVIFSQGQTKKSLRFCLKGAEQVGNFNC